MTYYIPAIVAMCAFALLIYLLQKDKNPEFTTKAVKYISRAGLDIPASERAFQSFKGLLFIIALTAMLGAIGFYAH